jgi:hypothetical protein
LDKLELRQFHFIPPVLLLPQDICLGLSYSIATISIYFYIRGINLLCQDNILWKYFTNYS